MLVCPVCKRPGGDGKGECSHFRRVNSIKVSAKKKRSLLRDYHCVPCALCGEPMDKCRSSRIVKAATAFRRENKAALKSGQEGHVPQFSEIHNRADEYSCKRVLTVVRAELPKWWKS